MYYDTDPRYNTKYKRKFRASTKLICTIKGCYNLVHLRRLCRKHFRLFDPGKPDQTQICEMPNCFGIVKAGGLCFNHYMQLRRKNTPKTRPKRNKIRIKGNKAFIQLYNIQGKPTVRAVIDSEDVNKIKGKKWHMAGNHVLNSHRKKLCNFIMGNNKSYNHKNKNTLDNRKCNLRVCTRAQTNRNRSLGKNNTTGYKGVVKIKTKGGNRYRVKIGVDYKEISIGVFDTKEQAAIAYNKAAKKYHGEFAVLNKV